MGLRPLPKGVKLERLSRHYDAYAVQHEGEYVGRVYSTTAGEWYFATTDQKSDVASFPTRDHAIRALLATVE